MSGLELNPVLEESDRTRILRAVEWVRARHLHGRNTGLEASYTLCYFLARRLRRKYYGVCIMVGDVEGERGPTAHHWLLLPSKQLYVDPTFDEFDPARAVRIGVITDEDYKCDYRNGLDGNFDLSDPRNHPRILFAAETLETGWR